MTGRDPKIERGIAGAVPRAMAVRSAGLHPQSAPSLHGALLAALLLLLLLSSSAAANVGGSFDREEEELADFRSVHETEPFSVFQEQPVFQDEPVFQEKLPEPVKAGSGLFDFWNGPRGEDMKSWSFGMGSVPRSKKNIFGFPEAATLLRHSLREVGRLSWPWRRMLNEDSEPPTSLEDSLHDARVQLQSSSQSCLKRRAREKPNNFTAAGENVFYRGEFGYELLVVLPFAYFHFLNASLGSTTSCGDPSMKIFYFFSPRHFFSAHCHREDIANEITPFGWTNGLHLSAIPKAWSPPPLAEHYSSCEKVWAEVPTGAKLVVIANKFENEWHRGPLNYFDQENLYKLIMRFLNAGFYVVYNRAGSSTVTDRWQNLPEKWLVKVPNFEDYKNITDMYSHPKYGSRIRLLQDLHKLVPKISYNELQARVMARSKCFVSVQGGTSILSSYFGGANIVFVRRGHELDGDVYKRVYPKLSGADVIIARNYRSVFANVNKMIKKFPCASL